VTDRIRASARPRTASELRPEGSRERRVLDVAGVACGDRLEDQDLSHFVGYRTVLDPTRHNAELASADVDRSVAELEEKAAVNSEKKLVLGLVVVPDEGSVKFDELLLLAVHLSHDFRPPVFGDQGEFFGDVDLVHGRGSGASSYGKAPRAVLPNPQA